MNKRQCGRTRGNVGVQEEETNPALEWAEIEEAEP